MMNFLRKHFKRPRLALIVFLVLGLAVLAYVGFLIHLFLLVISYLELSIGALR